MELTKEQKFYIFCIEVYKREKGLTGKQTIELFEKYDVESYVIDLFELLHIHGNAYIIKDIDDYIEARKKKGA